MIADDEPHIRSGLTALDWESIHVEVCGTASNGKEAIDMASSLLPDLILTDIRMPIVDGLDMAEQILKENQNCAILFLSGYEDFEYVKRALKMGACDYILKPAVPEEILKGCREALKRLRDKREHKQIFDQLRSMVVGTEEGGWEREGVKEGKINTREIVLYIESHYQEELALNDLAKAYHFNPIYINRMLKRDTGNTFLEILSNKRMSVAARLLEDTELKVNQVAERVGIPDQRYFSTLFKIYFQCSPREYRKAWKRKGT